MNRFRRALPKLMATGGLAAGLVSALVLLRPREGDMPSHGHHLGDLREEGIRLQRRGDLAGALDKFREAVRIAETERLKPALAANRIAIAAVHLTAERYGEAARELELALAAAREIGNRVEAATALAYLGQARRLQGRPEEAMAALREALDLAGDVPSRARAVAHFQTGEILREGGDLAAALAAYREAHAVLREMRDAPGEAAILMSIGRMEAAMGDTAAAGATLGRTRDLLRQLGFAERAAQVEEELAALGRRGK